MAAFLLPWTACMPEMQEQFPAGAWMARHRESKGNTLERTPKMQEHFSAGA